MTRFQLDRTWRPAPKKPATGEVWQPVSAKSAAAEDKPKTVGESIQQALRILVDNGYMVSYNPPRNYLQFLPPEGEDEPIDWSKSMGRLQVIPNDDDLLCVMCHAELPPEALENKARFIANGHSVCRKHVDAVIEAG